MDQVIKARNFVLGAFGPIVLLSALSIALVMLLATGQGIALYYAVTSATSDPFKITVALVALLVALVVSLKIFVISRMTAMSDQFGQLAVSIKDLQANEQSRINEKDDLRRKIDDLNARLASGGHQEEDTDTLWWPVAGSYMVNVFCKFRRECREIFRAGGVVEFELTETAIANWVQRIAVATALADWRIILPIPRVPGPFEPNALLPARKLLFILDKLAEVCTRQGRLYTFENIRIAIVREVEPKYRSLSITILKRQTIDGAEDITVTYQRPATDKIDPPYDNKVLVHRGDADRKHYAEIAERYFHGPSTVHLTVPELREALRTGIFPDVHQLDLQMEI